jgi:phosphoglycerol transferase
MADEPFGAQGLDPNDVTSRLRELRALARRFGSYGLPIAGIVVFVALLLRNSGLYPSVMDEYPYSTMSRLVPLAKASIPDYLYFTVYNLTNQCGDAFLSCARILNVAAFVGAAPFIYLTAKRVCTRGVATLVVILALVGPINTYTAYFMPEALYFLSFWVIAWFILGIDSIHARRKWIAAGVLLGAAALVKPHALFLIPGILLYLVYLGTRLGRENLRATIENGVLVVVVPLLTKFIGGFLLAGSAGLTLFGPTYGSVSESALSDLGGPSELLTVSAESLVGHVLAICLLYGLPIALSLAAAVRSLRSGNDSTASDRASVFAFLILADLLVVVALFTAFTAGGSVYESAYRLHMRYYNFALPLLFIVAGAQLGASPARPSANMFIGVLIGLAIVYALISRLEPYTPYLVDSPELRSITDQRALSLVLGFLSLATLALWSAGNRWGIRLFVYAFLPLAVIGSTIAASSELRLRLVPDQADRAGMLAAQYLPRSERSHVLVVGSDISQLYRALFYVDDPDPAFQVIPAGSIFDVSTLPEGKDWALIIGDHEWIGGSYSESPTPGFALVRGRP